LELSNFSTFAENASPLKEGYLVANLASLEVVSEETPQQFSIKYHELNRLLLALFILFSFQFEDLLVPKGFKDF
jgi:hypothetical protein